MPELPEVETVKRGLAPTMEGALLVRAELRRPDLRFPFPENFAEAVAGRRIIALSRRAKYLMIELEGGDVIIAHLGMTITESRNVAVAEIEEVIGDWAEALRRKDAARVLAHGTQECLVFSLAPPLKASDADAGGLEQWFSTWKGPLGFTFEDLDISVSGDVAFATALTHLSGEKHDGQKAALWYRLTLGLTRTDRGWKIAHQHESVPFYMSKAITALATDIVLNCFVVSATIVGA